jgi:hypothetical protein
MAKLFLKIKSGIFYKDAHEFQMLINVAHDVALPYSQMLGNFSTRITYWSTTIKKV